MARVNAQMEKIIAIFFPLSSNEFPFNRSFMTAANSMTLKTNKDPISVLNISMLIPMKLVPRMKIKAINDAIKIGRAKFFQNVNEFIQLGI